MKLGLTLVRESNLENDIAALSLSRNPSIKRFRVFAVNRNLRVKIDWFSGCALLTTTTDCAQVVRVNYWNIPRTEVFREYEESESRRFCPEK